MDNRDEWQDACTHAAASPQPQLTEAEASARDLDWPETNPDVMQRDFLGTP